MKWLKTRKGEVFAGVFTSVFTKGVELKLGQEGRQHLERHRRVKVTCLDV